MKEINKRFEFFSWYDHTGIQNHLEKMAESGWLLEKIGAFRWQYRRIEPQKVRFAVTFLPKVSEYDPGIGEQQQTYIDFCEAAGWKFATAKGQMQIFYHTDMDAVPIETDARMQVVAVHESMKQTFLWTYYLLLASGLLNLVNFFLQISHDLVDVLADGIRMFPGVCGIALVMITGSELWSYYSWRKKALVLAEEEGEFLETKGRHWIVYTSIAVMLFGFGSWAMYLKGRPEVRIMGLTMLYFLIFFVAIWLLMSILKKCKVPGRYNKALTLGFTFIGSTVLCMAIFATVIVGMNNRVFSDGAEETYEYKGLTFIRNLDELPVSTTDLLGTLAEDYSRKLDVTESLLLRKTEVRDWGIMSRLEQPNLEYTLIDVKLGLLYDVCLHELVQGEMIYNEGMPDEFTESYKVVQKSAWDADIVYREYLEMEPTNEYVICWDKQILKIDFDWEPTDSQIKTIVEKLKTS